MLVAIVLSYDSYYVILKKLFCDALFGPYTTKAE